jgi:hypothetical protein
MQLHYGYLASTKSQAMNQSRDKAFSPFCALLLWQGKNDLEQGVFSLKKRVVE